VTANAGIVADVILKASDIAMEILLVILKEE
jgi:hypothetical protein